MARWLAGGMAVAGLWHAAPALAQLVDAFFPPGIIGYNTDVGVTVATRARPDFDPLGIQLGSITVRPSFSEGLGYDSNPVLRPPSPGFATRTSPVVNSTLAVQVNSRWSKDNFSAYLSANDFRYPSASSQDTTNFTGSLGQTINIGEDILTGAVSHVSQSQTSRDLDTPPLDRAGVFTIDNVRLTYAANRGPFYFYPQLNYTAWRYDNVTSFGKPLNQTYRNRDIADASLLVKYGEALLRDFAAVLRGASIHYTNPEAGQPNRDATTFAALVGIDNAASSVWRTRLLVGYQARQFTSPALRATAAPIVEANVTWSPSGLTTITGSATRAIQDAAAEFTQSYTYNEVQLSIDHELLRNLLLRAYVDYQRADNQQGGGHETIEAAGASATWLMNRNMRLSGSYDYTTKHATSYGTLSESIVMLRLMLGI